MGTYFKLNEILDEIKITPNKLAERADLRPDTVYKVYRNDLKRIHIDVLDSIILTLNTINKENGSDKTYTISDLIDYK
jgi:predicted transcriptional regulator